MTRAALPLGVDVGTARTRVAHAVLDATGAPALVAVATRPTGDDPAGAIAAARAELRTRERRCVLALTAPDAVLRTVTFPAMNARERMRAARYEIARVADFAADAAVRVVATQRERYVVGAARRTALDARAGAARRAGLRPIAVDDTAFALLRAFPDAGAVVDVGDTSTVLCIRREPIPTVHIAGGGGAALTAALSTALAIDTASAEERKRTIGLGGAADHARDALVDALASALVAHRAACAEDVASVVLTGNGARLRGLATAVERAIAIPVRVGTLEAAAHAAYPDDVVRAASPDWALAYGLALWSAA